MRDTSPEVSESAEGSQSPPLAKRLTPRRPPARRRFFRRRPPPPPSTTTTPSSLSPGTQAHEDPASSGEESQLDSYSDYPSKSFVSSSASSASAPLPYINVAPLPVFRGLPGECPVAHLTRFERVCRANNAASLETVARIFPVTLLDDAALWYELAVEPRPDASWEGTKSAFLLAFRRPDYPDSARSELLSLRQREGESVNSYHLRMQWILKRWPEHGLPNSLIRGLFMDGLREEFHDWVVPRRPANVEEAVKLAMDWEGAQAARAARRRGGEGERCGFCEGKHLEADCEARRRMKEEWMRRTRAAEERKSGYGEGKEAEEDGEEQVGEGRLGRIGSIGRRSACQCWKHQCWKKYERSGSALTVKTAAAAAAADAAAAPEAVDVATASIPEK